MKTKTKTKRTKPTDIKINKTGPFKTMVLYDEKGAEIRRTQFRLTEVESALFEAKRKLEAKLLKARAFTLGIRELLEANSKGEDYKKIMEELK